jgi:hypothetical protein
MASFIAAAFIAASCALLIVSISAHRREFWGQSQ